MARPLGKAVVATLVTAVVLELVIAASFLAIGAGADHLRGSWIAFSILALPVSFVFGAVASAIVSGRARPPD
ncbi:MAG TPA: hypothetical protein VGB53_07085 [Rubricoccaceae bacterium]|jgi:hypothetical protein